MNPLRSLVRSGAFVGKEVAEVIRQPRLLLVLVLGPFLILLLFGMGYREEARPRETVFVVGQDNPVRDQVSEFAQSLGPQVVFGGVTTDMDEALSRLEQGEIDLVVQVPDDPYERVRADEHPTFVLIHREINPVQSDFVGRLGRAYVDEVNREVQKRIAEDTQQRSGDLEDEVTSAHALALSLERSLAPSPETRRAGELADELELIQRRIDELGLVSPEVIVQPFVTEVRSISEVSPTLSTYFIPSVLVLLLQHLAVTFAALSIVRDRRQGSIELFRVSPMTSSEMLIGKYVAYMILGGAVGAVLTLAVVYGLGAPLLGSWLNYTLVMAALLFASLSAGFLISLVSNTENQAVQYSMLLLLTSVFFSGFLVILDALAPYVRVISWLLPATYAIELLREVMFRGNLLEPQLLYILAGGGMVLAVVDWLLLRSRMSRL